MTEDEAKTKICWRTKGTLYPSYCDTRECMAWESEYQKDNITHKWVKTDSGDCGMKSKENGCFYPG